MGKFLKLSSMGIQTPSALFAPTDYHTTTTAFLCRLSVRGFRAEKVLLFSLPFSSCGPPSAAPAVWKFLRVSYRAERNCNAFFTAGLKAKKVRYTSVILHLIADCSEEGLKLLFVRILVWLKINLHTAHVFVVAEKLCCLLSELPQLRVCQVVEVGVKITELTCIVIVVQLDHFPAVEAGIDEGDDLFNTLGCGVGRRCLPVDRIVIRSEVASVFGGCPACCLGVATFLWPEFDITTI